MNVSLLAKVREFARVMGELRSVAPAMRYRIPDDGDIASLGRRFEQTAARCPDNVMLIVGERQWTYAQFNHEVNRFARVLQNQGLRRGDSVALFMENRAEFVLALLATVKLGASCSLINHSLTGAALVHCLRAAGSKACIVGDERRVVLDEVREHLEFRAGQDYYWFSDLDDSDAPEWALNARVEMYAMAAENLEVTGEIRAGETALHIFTSGTTGLPKAVLMPHRKVLGAGEGMGKIGFRIKATDRLYLCLPIYHITGLGPGFCGFICAGASIVLRRKFSASLFWSEVQRYQTNCFVYVGELCRYLTSQPETPEERNNPLEKMLGNGLRPDVWDEFKTRFEVSRICEIYGSSEGNVSFANILNKEKTIGAALTPIAVVAYDMDLDQVLRDGHGRAIQVPAGESGLLLGEISPKYKFDGYTDREATAKKIIENVEKNGDRWFNTGDLVKQIDVGFALGLRHFQFVDRTGDTFRWRAENVSTNEVAEALNKHPQIVMANVYGVEVPGTEGRAGMVAFAMNRDEIFDADALTALVDQELPLYARPVFVRIQRALETTGTFKLMKGELREQAFHLNRVNGDEILVRKPGGDAYEVLDEQFYRVLVSGASGY